MADEEETDPFIRVVVEPLVPEDYTLVFKGSVHPQDMNTAIARRVFAIGV